jgi:hypothetical protein
MNLSTKKISLNHLKNLFNTLIELEKRKKNNIEKLILNQTFLGLVINLNL